MRKSGLFLFGLLIVSLLCIGVVSADPQIVDGYYQITSTDDLTWFANQVNDGHVTYNAKLMNDLDYTDKTFTKIGTVTYRFAGVFEGNGYSIKNIIGGNTFLMWGGYYFNLSLDSIELSTYVPFVDVIFNKCVFENISISSPNNAEICAGGTVTDCLFINCHATGTGSNGAIFQEVESVRCYFSNCYLTGSTTASLGRPTYPLSTTDCVIKSLNLQTTDSSYAKTAYFAKISGHTPTITKSYSSDTIVSSSNIEGATLYRGTVVSNTLLNNVNFYNGVGISGTTYLSWDFTNTWYWDSVNNMPKLRAFIHTPPTISSITGPASPVTINTAITSTVTASPTVSGDSLTYKWQVNTGSTWADISGQTTNTLSYTPSVAGTYQFRCIVTESKIGSGLSATSNIVSTIAVTTPIIGTATINQSIGKINTLYSPVDIGFSLTSLGGANTVYYKVETSIDGTTWEYGGVSGEATATGIKSASLQIIDATATTHYYRVLVSSLSDYRQSVTTTSNTVTFQTYAPPIQPTVTINPSTITVSTATTVSLSASNVPSSPSGNPYTYSWYYGDGNTVSQSDTLIGQWSDISQPYTWNIPNNLFTTTGTKIVYLHIQDSLGQTTNSNLAQLSIQSVSATVAWSQAYHGLNDNFVMSVSGAQSGASYQWYYQQTAPSVGSDVIISGATSSSYQTTANLLGLISGNSYCFKCVVNGAYTVSTSSITPYADPSVSTPTASSTKIVVPGSSVLTAQVSNPATVSSYQWQIYQSSTWTNIASATSNTYSASISIAGEYDYRVIVNGLSGRSVTSDSVSIVAGAAPTITITAPQNGERISTKGHINVTATATGIGNRYVWNFGDSSATHGDTTSLNTWVQYKYSGDKTITLTATNEYGSATTQITINYYDASSRPMATATIAPVPTTAVGQLTNVVNVSPGTYPSIKDTVNAVMSPLEEVMPTGFVFVIVFGVIFLMLWLITKNTAIPAVIGIIFGAFLLALFPASYYGPALIILAISIAGGMYRVFRPPQ